MMKQSDAKTMDGKSSQIKISAIVPTYNRAHMVSNTLRSLKCQVVERNMK